MRWRHRHGLSRTISAGNRIERRPLCEWRVTAVMNRVIIFRTFENGKGHARGVPVSLFHGRNPGGWFLWVFSEESTHPPNRFSGNIQISKRELEQTMFSLTAVGGRNPNEIKINYRDFISGVVPGRWF